MENNTELDNLAREVQRKLGRNIILFQSIEHMMKHVNINQEIKLWQSDEGIISNLQERKNNFTNRMMGLVGKQFVTNIFKISKQIEGDKPAEESGPTMMTLRWQIECDEGFIEDRKEKLEILIKERNDLVHHFISKCNFVDYDSMVAAEKYLDQQRERVLPEYELLAELVQNFQDSRQEFAEVLKSEEVTKDLILCQLRNTQYVAGLIVYANKNMRHDGWSELSSAGSFLQKNIPESQRIEELALIKKIYGCKKLKDIVDTSEYFDTYQESTDKGGIRFLYRLKPNLN